MLNASCTAEDEEKLEELAVRCRTIGVMCWVLDPEILCQGCGGYRLGASPPDENSIDKRPDPCSCQHHGGTAEGNTRAF